MHNQLQYYEKNLVSNLVLTFVVYVNSIKVNHEEIMFAM